MYGRQYGRGGFQNDIRRYFQTNGAPLTMAILAATMTSFLMSFLLISSSSGGFIVMKLLAFSNKTFPLYFWTPLTWPIAAPLSPLSLIFSMMTFLWIGGSLERSWGTRVFAGFMAATSALTALSLYAAGWIFHKEVFVSGLYLASVAPLVAWATINRREYISIWGILSVPAPYLALFAVGMTWFSFGMGAQNAFFGAFALSGSAAAYWYVTKMRYAFNGFKRYRTDDSTSGFSLFNIFKRGNDTKRETPVSDEDKPQDGGLNPLRRLKEERERKEREKRLEDMFRRSGYGDDYTKDR